MKAALAPLRTGFPGCKHRRERRRSSSCGSQMVKPGRHAGAHTLVRDPSRGGRGTRHGGV